jgi:hypothetical protein
MFNAILLLKVMQNILIVGPPRSLQMVLCEDLWRDPELKNIG